MARPPFTPDDEQSKTLAEIARLGKQRADIRQQLRDVNAELDPLIALAETQRIPVNAVAVALGSTRKTVYRHKPPRSKK